MNVQTVLRLAAANNYDPAVWVQLRLSMMNSTLPWRDPDAVFVSLTETLAGGWVITVNYNGAGGVNDGISEMVAWMTDSVTDVIPARHGLLNAQNLIEYAAVLVSGIPADAAAWQPQMVAGMVLNVSATQTIGIELNITGVASAGSRGVTSLTPGSGLTNANTRAAMGYGIPTADKIGFVSAAGYTAAGVATNAMSQVTTSGTSVVPSDTGFLVAQGNAVNNPVAGNRACATKFFVRVFDLPTSWAPWVDATGWSELGCTSPFTVGTPSSDPNTLFSSADTSGAPEWRVTIADTGKTGPFDGFSEGIEWLATRPSDLDYRIPTVWAIEVTSITAYSGTQRYGMGIGLLDGATGGAASTQGMNAVPAIGSNAVQATANVLNGTFSNWPGVADGMAGITWPQWDTAGIVYVGQPVSVLQLAGTLFSNGYSSLAGSLSAITGTTQVMMTITKDTNTLGTSDPELRWRTWWSQPARYQRVWPA